MYRTDLRIGEVVYKFVSYNIRVSWPFPMKDFELCFLLHDSDSETIYC